MKIGCIRHPVRGAARSVALQTRDRSKPHAILDQRSSISRCSASGMTRAAVPRERGRKESRLFPIQLKRAAA